MLQTYKCQVLDAVWNDLYNGREIEGVHKNIATRKQEKGRTHYPGVT